MNLLPDIKNTCGELYDYSRHVVRAFKRSLNFVSSISRRTYANRVKSVSSRRRSRRSTPRARAASTARRLCGEDAQPLTLAGDTDTATEGDGDADGAQCFSHTSSTAAWRAT